MTSQDDVKATLRDIGITEADADSFLDRYPLELVAKKAAKMVGRSLANPRAYLGVILDKDLPGWHARHPERPTVSHRSQKSRFDLSLCDLSPYTADICATAKAYAARLWPNTDVTRPIVEANFARELAAGATPSQLLEKFGSLAMLYPPPAIGAQT